MSILALTSNTLVTAAAGQIEYDGQFFATDSNASRAQMQRIVRTTAVNSTSGTSIDFTGIPAWVEKITVIFQGVSLSSTAQILVQLGTGSTTYTTSGYLSTSAAVSGTTSVSNVSSGFNIRTDGAAQLVSGTMTIVNITGNSWVSSHSTKQSTTTAMFGAGDVALGAVLTAVRITSTSTDTFDLGTINIIYEG